MSPRAHTTEGEHTGSVAHTPVHRDVLDHAQLENGSRTASSNLLSITTTSIEHVLPAPSPELPSHTAALTATSQPNATQWSILLAVAHQAGFHRVPRDVVQLIFEALLDAEPNQGYNELVTMPQRMRVPLLLGAVCRLWRTIADTTPTLWRTYVCSINLDPSVNDDQIDSVRIQHYLARAGADTIGLALLLVIRGPRDGSLVARVGLAVRMIPLLRRISHATIVVSERAHVMDASTDQFLTILGNTSAPLLRSARLQDGSNRLLWMTAGSANFFGGKMMSRVHSLTLNRVQVHATPDNVLRFGNIETLTVFGSFGVLHAVTLPAILAALPNLTTLAFDCHRIIVPRALLRPGTIVPPQTVHHPTLVNFFLVTDHLDAEVIEAIRFDFPGLRQLRLAFPKTKACHCTTKAPPLQGETTGEKLAFLRAIARNSPNLNTVRIIDICLDKRVANALCMPELRSLRILELQNVNMYSTFWDVLREKVQKSEVPALRGITCKEAFVYEKEPLKALITFAEAQRAENESPAQQQVYVALSDVRFNIPQTVIDTHLGLVRFLMGIVPPSGLVLSCPAAPSSPTPALEMQPQSGPSAAISPVMDSALGHQIGAASRSQVDGLSQRKLYLLKDDRASQFIAKKTVVLLERHYPALQGGVRSNKDGDQLNSGLLQLAEIWRKFVRRTVRET